MLRNRKARNIVRIKIRGVFFNSNLSKYCFVLVAFYQQHPQNPGRDGYRVFMWYKINVLLDTSSLLGFCNLGGAIRNHIRNTIRMMSGMRNGILIIILLRGYIAGFFVDDGSCLTLQKMKTRT
jgi:hypothetical protein